MFPFFVNVLFPDVKNQLFHFSVYWALNGLNHATSAGCNKFVNRFGIKHASTLLTFKLSLKFDVVWQVAWSKTNTDFLIPLSLLWDTKTLSTNDSLIVNESNVGFVLSYYNDVTTIKIEI